MSPKPQPWYAKFNQPPRSPNGRNWKPSAPAHRDPTDRAGDSPRADAADVAHYAIRTSLPTAAWRSLNTPFFPPPTPPSIPYAGVRAGEIIGHRMWWVLNDNQLCSLAHYFPWEPGATIEGNIDEKVTSFMSGVYGGVYSYADPSFIVAELPVEDLPFPTIICFNPFVPYRYTCLGVATGTIKCWGEVVEHEKGYRAQYAKLLSIDSVIGAVDLQTLRTKYHV